MTADQKGLTARELARFHPPRTKIEDRHAVHTVDRPADARSRSGFGDARFLKGAHTMLDGVIRFREGIEPRRSDPARG